MLKNKEDNFLGDKITNNVKYADNEWQAQGTVDRNSMYSKENLLNLLFEENNYQKDLGDYKDYIPRGSTDNAFGKPYVAAKLEHDLILLDAIYYVSTAISSSINIFDIDVYLKKAFAVANPVYDDKSACEILYMVDPDKVDDSVTLKDFFDLLNPYFYEGSVFGETSSLTNGQKSSFYKFLYKRYGVSNGNVSLKEIAKNEKFKNDFQLHIHNKDTIKMPFNVRGTTDEENLDNRTYRTRFIANVLAGGMFGNEKVKPYYIEYLNDIVEEALYSNVTIKKYFQDQSNTFKESIQTFQNLGKSYTNDDGNSDVVAYLEDKGFSHILNKYLETGSSVEKKTILENLLKNILSQPSNISTYCTPVYTGYDAQNPFYSTYGIYLLNEEDSGNLFQDADNSYKLFNTLVLGYKTVDSLIGTRTFLGTSWMAIYQAVNGTENNDPLRDEINLRDSEEKSFIDAFGIGSKPYYISITMLNSLYKLGHGENLVDVQDPQEKSGSYAYDFHEDIKRWLKEECVLFKGPIYGDYVEELNFMQDLNPDSDVQFSNIRVKKTEIPYRRFQDSKYEIPYVEQTAPLLTNTSENEKGIGVYGSGALAGVGNLKGTDSEKSQKVLPPFIYDFDKGDEESSIIGSDRRQRSKNGDAQRINAKIGGIAVEDRITSPTIDELWTFLKYLTESDGKNRVSNFHRTNERLPSFYGTDFEKVKDTLVFFGGLEGKKVSSGDINENTVNPLSKDSNARQIDILNWEPVTKNIKMHYDSDVKPELQFGGYKITRYIEKIYDYKVNVFGRRVKGTDETDPRIQWDKSAYEFNTEDLNNYDNVTGYLEKLFNQTILDFSLESDDLSGFGDMHSVGETTLTVDALDNTDKARTIFNTDNDEKLLTKNSPLTSSEERKKAFDFLAQILVYHKASDGINDVIDGKETSYHNHFKKYLDQPKNLKEIERDLETIRQNLQTVVEYIVATSASRGFADRSFNRGTIHQLHRNNFTFDSTLLRDRTVENEKGEEVFDALNATESLLDTVHLNSLSDALNNLYDSLKVTNLDRKVVFDDGKFDERYQWDFYDRFIIDLKDAIENTRAKHEMYRPNETLLSEIYLAADGTWRSIHEHTILPVVYDEW